MQHRNVIKAADLQTALHSPEIFATSCLVSSSVIGKTMGWTVHLLGLQGLVLCRTCPAELPVPCSGSRTNAKLFYREKVCREWSWIHGFMVPVLQRMILSGVSAVRRMSTLEHRRELQCQGRVLCSHWEKLEGFMLLDDHFRNWSNTELWPLQRLFAIQGCSPKLLLSDHQISR